MRCLRKTQYQYCYWRDHSATCLLLPHDKVCCAVLAEIAQANGLALEGVLSAPRSVIRLEMFLQNYPKVSYS